MSLADDLARSLDPAALFEAATGNPPLDWQVGYLRETRPTLLTKGRQCGASTAAAVLAVSTVLYTPDVAAVVVSPTLKQSSEIVVKARAAFRRLGVRLVQDSASMLRLPSGSRVISLPGSDRSVRGWTAKLLIVDECAFVGEETLAAARGIVATGGRLILQSTPWLESGSFHALATSDELPGWARLTVRSDEVPTISPAFLAAEREALSENTFNREYLCRFGSTGVSLFSVDRLNSLVRPRKEQSA